MSKYQLVAVDDDKKVVQMLNEDVDSNFLESIVEAREGIVWVGNKVCDLKVIPA